MGACGDIEPSAQGREITGVKTDSRAVGPGDLFVCLPGENFDGHNFASQAVDNGAIAVLADRPLPELHDRASVLLVTDTLTALGRLGAFWRSRTSAIVVAVTGSAGKTTTKEMLASILSEVGETAKNYKNFNNQLGVPMCMLGFSGTEKFWVLELGISHPHDMHELGDIVRPDCAVIGNIGPVHLEGLGNLDGVARCKTDLLDYTRRSGRAYVSMDYPELWAHATTRFPFTVGLSVQGRSERFHASYLGADRSGGRYALRLDDVEIELHLPYFGEYFAENMLAAAATAHDLGAGPEAIRRGLEKARLPEHRSACSVVGGWAVIDDTYNANPLSMERAVKCAADIAGETPLALVLGEMRELGPDAAELHRELGRTIAATGAKAVFFNGDHADALAAGLADGNWQGAFATAPSPENFPDAFAELGLSGGVVLFKGSRSTKMERYVQSLTDWLNGETRA
nr:UDP-N-acetylmuramoyl-tripeptide--D-alanyl-D-alanine ligase [Desulfobaculum xiamenense]